MTNEKASSSTISPEQNSHRRRKLGTILYSDKSIFANQDDSESYRRSSSASAPTPRFHHHSTTMSTPSPRHGDASPAYFMSPWIQPSPFTKSPWAFTQHAPTFEPYESDRKISKYGLIGSLFREEGHIYSLAATRDLLYTGSDSRNIRVWKNLQDFSGFKSHCGMVKAIVVLGEKIFTGHQDGKIRLWKISGSKKKDYNRIGSLPTTKDYLKTSINLKNYVQVRRNSLRPWIKHFDAVSCLSVDLEQGLLYSGSWDKTFKVWRISNSKCLESINGHDDAINSIRVGFDGLVFTGSADGTVKVWRRELVGNHSMHILVETLLKQENSVTSLAVNAAAGVVYAGSSDGLVNFWEREKHFMISHGGVLRGHKLAVLCLAAAGNLVLSGSADKSIWVWSRQEGGDHVCLSVLTGHSGPVKCLAIAEDSDYQEAHKGERPWMVYSGSLDKSIKVWRVSENAP